MTKARTTPRLLLISALLLAGALPALAQHGFTIITGKEFDSALPTQFYLEGNAIPTEKRNAVLVHTAAGKRALFALLDTSGYSSAIQQKYEGMIITEGRLSVCGHVLGAGSYGFGMRRPMPGKKGTATFMLYNQAGAGLGGCTITENLAKQQPRPLEVVTESNGRAQLYLGKFAVVLR